MGIKQRYEKRIIFGLPRYPKLYFNSFYLFCKRISYFIREFFSLDFFFCVVFVEQRSFTIAFTP